MHVHRDGQLDITFDEAFERRWDRVQRVGLIALGLFVAAAACGAFGRGPLADATVATPDGTVVLRYERIARNRTPSTSRLEVTGSAAAPGALRVRLSSDLINGLTAAEIEPRPLAARAIGGGVEFRFAHDGAATIRLPYEPATIGIVRGEIQVGAEPPVAVRTLVLP